MASDIRQGEEEVLEDWLEEEEIPFQTTTDRVEGGDVIVDRQTVYVGISSRTSEAAVRKLKRDLPDHEIVQVPFHDKYSAPRLRIQYPLTGSRTDFPEGAGRENDCHAFRADIQTHRSIRRRTIHNGHECLIHR